jgi:hypothetical protein
MLRFAADENFNNNILRGILQREPGLDIVRVQDVGLSGVDDPGILAWTAEEGRVLLTHDVNTITKYAYERIATGLRMSGVFEVNLDAPVGRIIDDLLLLALLSLDNEWENRIGYVPLK